MTLKEKFSALLPFYNENDNNNKSIQCELIADDYAIEFAKWMDKSNYYIEIYKHLKTYEELLEIFKKRKSIMKLNKKQLLVAQKALGYSIMYAKTESETAEFSLLKLDIDGALIRIEAEEYRKVQHNKMECPFNYCDANPQCVGKCHYL